MTPDQCFKSCIFLADQKGIEQLRVCQPIRLLQKGRAAKMPDDSAHWRGCHTRHPGAYPSLASLIYWPRGGIFPQLFCRLFLLRDHLALELREVVLDRLRHFFQ
jgi:hypothetical protein